MKSPESVSRHTGILALGTPHLPHALSSSRDSRKQGRITLTTNLLPVPGWWDDSQTDTLVKRPARFPPSNCYLKNIPRLCNHLHLRQFQTKENESAVLIDSMQILASTFKCLRHCPNILSQKILRLDHVTSNVELRRDWALGTPGSACSSCPS
jgi:hypothetical protein